MSTNNTSIFETTGQIGAASALGHTQHNKNEQSHTITGAGHGLGDTEDAFQWAARKTTSDFVLTVQGECLDATKNPHTQWGVCLRASLASNAMHASAVLHNGTVSLQHRASQGAHASTVFATPNTANVVQLERAGQNIIMRVATFGEPLEEMARLRLDVENEIFVGLFVCSPQTNAPTSVVFHNVRFDVPAAPGTDGYTNPAASRLELLELATGQRRVVYTSDKHFEAPNWSRDGSFLLYNQDGNIYKLPFGSSHPTLLDTGQVQANNNDHGISFDGTRLALSSHTEQTGQKAGSQIYVVDIEGGEPKQITTQAPSYWHGWSPDGTTLVYCAERHDNYDIYAIAATGGPETQLTQVPGLNDGPEFSPDGAHIYFNSTRTGQMKIWRMQPNGDHQEQISFGDGHDWFAHPSPDGTRIVYVSYPASVAAASHPHNQHVMLREQNLSNGKVRVLAYLYGGQGTINVPSWNPDGTHLAFVSYTYGDPSV